MNKFRPQDISTRYIMRERRVTGRVENYNWQTRDKWYPAGWKTNQISIGRRFGHLHYLACHSPELVRRRWSAAYKQFCNQHLADRGKASVRYLNKWTCHAWL
jgi:hypothetical protein